MTPVSYIPGTWLGILRSRTAVLLGPDTQPALVAAIWELLESRPEVHEVLHTVTSSSGGSLANIPSFGILDFQGPLRVFLRGDLDVTVQSSDGPVELNGRDVTTWTERRLPAPGLCRLTIPGAGGNVPAFSGPASSNRPTAGEPVPGQPDSHLPELPLGDGVVLLQSLSVALSSGSNLLAGPGPAAAAPVVAAPPPAAPLVASAVVEPSVPEEELMERTIAPEHGVSAETVYAVIDEDFDADPGEDNDPHADSGAEAASGTGTAAHGDALAGAETVTGPETAPGAETVTGPETVTGSAGTGSAGSGSDTGMMAVGVPAGHDAPENAASAAAEQAAVAEMTSSYDHLWERTVVRNIEDAAVREDPETDHAEAPAMTAPVLTATAHKAPGDGTGDTTTGDGKAPVPPAESGAPDSKDGQPDIPPAVVPGTPAAAPPGPEPARPAAGGLIDSVPWRTADAGTAGPQPAAPLPVMASVPAAALPVAPFAGNPAPGTVQADYDGDHDGQTVMKSSLAGTAARPAPEAKATSADGPLVLARLCPQDHANPPTNSTCATCGAGLLPDAVQVARPRLGRMRISTGELVDLDQSLVIGRQPSVSRVQGGVMPRLVQVASPGGDISRSHVEVRLEGWHVMLCDLKATNGTVLVREGQPPRRLAQNEMAILLDGDIAELGDNISLRFEEIP